MPAPRRSAEEQYQLVLECRSSGLTDYQWCTEHHINPGTFYNWVKRLRQKSCYEIPPASSTISVPQDRPDIVKVQIVPDRAGKQDIIEPIAIPDPPDPVSTADEMTMEIWMNNIRIRTSNTVKPELLLLLVSHVNRSSTC